MAKTLWRQVRVINNNSATSCGERLRIGALMATSIWIWDCNRSEAECRRLRECRCASAAEQEIGGDERLLHLSAVQEGLWQITRLQIGRELSLC